MSGAAEAANQRRAPAGKTASKTKASENATTAKQAELEKRRKELEEKLVALEQQAWEEEKNQNADFFRAAMTEQFVAAEPDGKRYSKAEVLLLIPTVRVTSFELADFELLLAGRDAAVLTYRVTITGPVEGKEATTKMLATTVWVRRGTKWKMTFHQKTLAPE